MVQELNFSGIEFLLPILSFLVVLIISYAAVLKSKLIENKLIGALVSFIIASVFVTASGPRSFILVLMPWVAVLIVCVFLFLALAGALGKDYGFPTKVVGTTFVVLLAAIIVLSAIFVFTPYFSAYLPWNSGSGGNSDVLMVTDWIFSPQVFGALLLLGLGIVVSWILIKAK